MYRKYRSMVSPLTVALIICFSLNHWVFNEKKNDLVSGNEFLRDINYVIDLSGFFHKFLPARLTVAKLVDFGFLKTR